MTRTYDEVSVIMSFYAKDEPEQLKEALKSISGQTHRNLEIILIQDGPVPEGLLRTALTFAALDDRIVFFRNERNMGLTFSLNRAIDLTKGEYIARQDSDDISLPERIEKQLERMCEDDLDILGTWFYELNSKNGKRVLRRTPVGQADILKIMPVTSPFCHGSVMFKKRAILSLGKYIEPPPNEDYGLWWEACKHKLKMQNLPDPLYVFSVDPGKYFKRRRGIAIAYVETALRFRIIREGGYPAVYFVWAVIIFFIRLLPAALLKVLYFLNRYFRRAKLEEGSGP